MRKIITIAQGCVLCLVGFATVFGTVQAAYASSSKTSYQPPQATQNAVNPIFIKPSGGKVYISRLIDSNQDKLVVEGNQSKLNISVTYHDGNRIVNEDDTEPFLSQELILCDLNGNGKTELMDFESNPSTRDTFLEIFANQGKDNFTSVTGLDLHSMRSPLDLKFALNTVVIRDSAYKFNGKEFLSLGKVVGAVGAVQSTPTTRNIGSGNGSKGVATNGQSHVLGLTDFLESFDMQAMHKSVPFMISGPSAESGTEFTTQLTPNVMLDLTYDNLTTDIKSIEMLGSFQTSNASADISDCMNVLISVLAPNATNQERKSIADGLFKKGESLPNISNKVSLNGYTFFVKGEPKGLILLIYPNS